MVQKLMKKLSEYMLAPGAAHALHRQRKNNTHSQLKKHNNKKSHTT